MREIYFYTCWGKTAAIRMGYHIGFPYSDEEAMEIEKICTQQCEKEQHYVNLLEQSITLEKEMNTLKKEMDINITKGVIIGNKITSILDKRYDPKTCQTYNKNLFYLGKEEEALFNATNSLRENLNEMMRKHSKIEEEISFLLQESLEIEASQLA